jgi:hypothetical protein
MNEFINYKQSHEFKKTDNNKNNNNGCLKRVVAAILIIAVLLILASFAIPYMAYYAIIFITFYTIFALIVVALAAILIKSKKESEKNRGDGIDDNQSIPKASSDSKVNRPTPPETSNPSLLKVAIMSGIIGIIVAFIFVHRENAGVNVNWKYLPKPDDSPIEEILSDQSFVVVKTQSGNRLIARHALCYEYCWDDNFSRWAFKEEEAVNDPSCAARSLPKQPPDKQTGEEYIFRQCKHGAVYETRIVVAEDGGLWVWYKLIESTLNVVFRSIFTYGFFAAPAFALVGVLLYKGVNKFRVWMMYS